MQQLLEIENLSVSLRQENLAIDAVKKISFKIGTGEIIAIAGESGSGKSITALSVMGLLPQQALVTGNIIWHDPVSGPCRLLHNRQMQKIRANGISMIFQEPMTSLNPLMRCGDQVAEALKNSPHRKKGNIKKQALEALALSGFAIPSNVYTRFPHQLSGGQRQRVMIAMAIIRQPKLLIADEPTTALDMRTQKEILSTLAELKHKMGMSVMIISHDLGVIADIADKVVIMNKGEIMETGETQKVLGFPEHPYTKALMKCRVAGYPKAMRLPIMSDLLNLPSTQPIDIIREEPAKNTEDPLLRIENLSVHVKGNRKKTEKNKILDDVSFNIYPNEIVGLVGESGCGKTTLGRTLLGLIEPSGGRVLLRNKDIRQLKGKSLLSMHGEMQVVFQDPFGSLNPRLTAGSAIIEAMKVHGKHQHSAARKEKAVELLEMVNLEADHLRRYPHQFSGGQRQRICLARALATEPSFIVFDEAVSALDVSVQAQILNLINDLKSLFGFTALFISHDLTLVHYISDRTLVMRSGKIIEQGSADEVFHHPRENYTKMLLECIPGKSLRLP